MDVKRESPAAKSEARLDDRKASLMLAFTDFIHYCPTSGSPA
jgi:hypothetical protein